MFALMYGLLCGACVAYIAHLASGRRWVAWLASGATASAWGLLTALLLTRGLEAGHWPLSNRYEFALLFAWAIVGIYLLLELSWRERRAGSFAVGVALLVAGYAITRPVDMRVMKPLPPVLRSVWLQIHVLTAAVAYGAFGVGAGLGLMQLMRGPGSPVAEDEIELTTERLVALGFPWLTLSILTGAIWAQRAWGRYWAWDPKETWALITWLWYLLILHVRPPRRWGGRGLAALAVGGFAIVLFTFIGVPWLVRLVRLESLHGF
jgi:ABC-type transport system involved in cytochrome c biogenesis permease subunit